MTYDVLSPEAAELWAYSPDWDSGFNVTRSFSTDIFVSRDNNEQRRSLRFSPRFSINYRTTLQDSERRAASRWLGAWQNKPTIVPDFARWARLTGASIIGATTLTITPMPAWVGVAQPLVLCASDGTHEVGLVESVVGDTITLADPLANAWAIDSILRPTFRGLLDGNIRSDRPNKAAAQFSIVLDAYPGGDPPRAAGTAWASVGAREVFTLNPDYSRPPQLGYVWPVENIDVDRGRTAQFRPIDWPQSAIASEFGGLGTAAAAEVEQFFDRMKGRRGAFYLPTGDSDALFVSSAASTITVVGTDLAAQFAGFDYATYENGIAVFLTDGTKLYRRISAITAISSNTRFTVTSPWGVAVNSGNVARISLMPLVRFASDEMTTSWQTPLTARTRLTFQSVRR